MSVHNDEIRDAVAKAMCAVETRSKAATFEEVARGIERWTRHRYEAENLISELADYGIEVRIRESDAASARAAVLAAVDEIKNPFGRATAAQENLVLDSALKWVGGKS